MCACTVGYLLGADGITCSGKISVRLEIYRSLSIEFAYF